MANPADTTNSPAKRKCSVEDCALLGRVILHPTAGYLCHTHYYRLKKTGAFELRPLAGRRRGVTRTSPSNMPEASTQELICTAEDCKRKQAKASFCDMHYQRQRKRGSLRLTSTPRGQTLRWIKQHAQYTGDDCLTWPFAFYPSGYGQINFQGRPRNAHRVMCIVAHGEAPFDKADAAHSCGNGHLGCCNPKHLSWKTHAANMADCEIHGTVARGEKYPASKVSDADALKIYKDSRSNADIAKAYGVHRKLVYGIKNGITRSWLTGHRR